MTQSSSSPLGAAVKERARHLQTESAFKVLARARELEAAGRDIVHLEIGQPDFPTPAPICEAAIEAIRQGHTGYGPTPGLPALREAIAGAASQIRGIAYKPEEVVVAPGGKPILYYTINALTGPGDEVIYPDPCFPIYPSVIVHAGATPVPLRLREERHFRFDPDEFLDLLSPRTRLIMLSSPHNPTGGILEPEDLQLIADVARERDLLVLSDEVYNQIVYDDDFASIASLPGMKERTVVADSFSKTYSMTGWRVGFGLVPEDLAEIFELYSVNIVSCVTTFAQHGAMEALRMDQQPVRDMVAAFRERRDALVDALNEIDGFRCQRPAGAFYAFPSVRGTGRSSAELARELLEEAGVAALDGADFGSAGEGFLRFSYASSPENLLEACRRIRDYLGASRA